MRFSIVEPATASDRTPASKTEAKRADMRYLILSDIHSNLVALEAVLEDAPSGLPVWCLGDLVGYGPNPNECVNRLRELEPKCIVGNHDWAVMGQADIDDFNPEAKEAVLWTRKQLTPDNMAYLQHLPISLIEGEFTLVHGSPRKPIWEYILHPSTASLNFAYFNTAYCLVGHTHVPEIFRFLDQDSKPTCEPERLWEPGTYPLGEGRLIINPGSIGQPRDGNSRASYAILDTEAKTLNLHRVTYDIDKTQRLMEKAKLPRRLVLRLSYGW
jgi:diadenosine tetraphosphatase ApaH/serine/threonine PP2A family protein phosphatase